jgi:hypothetical protein
MEPSEPNPYLTFGEPDETVMVSWQEGSEVKECGFPSPGTDAGETEQPESVKLAGVPCCSARARVMGRVTGAENFAMMLPAPRIVAVVLALPAAAKVIPPESLDQILKR